MNKSCAKLTMYITLRLPNVLARSKEQILNLCVRCNKPIWTLANGPKIKFRHKFINIGGCK